MNPPGPTKSTARRLLESGIIFSVISFVTSLVNFAFQGLIGRRFAGHEGEFGLANNTINFISFLGTPLTIAATAVTHYIAHYRASGDQARFRGLLLGCRKLLFWCTIGGSVLAIVLVVPLSKFFNFDRYSVVLIALVCVLIGLWQSFATALCQGLAWFKRLAIFGFLGALLKVAFTWYASLKHPVAEVAVASMGIAFLTSFLVLFWRKEIFQKGEALSPWDRDFVLYLVAGAACVAGNYFFLSGDQLMSQRYFNPVDRDNYSLANRLATALPIAVGPLLIVLFTSRSGDRTGDAVSAQLKLLGLYAVGMLIGAFSLLLLRDFCIRLIRGAASPEAAVMIAPMAVTMVFGGLLQALGTWALASRWRRVSVVYGALGGVYWLLLLCVGTSPQRLLAVMPIASGVAFAIMFVVWIAEMRRKRASAQSA